MRIKSVLKKCKRLFKIYTLISNKFYCLLTIISPIINTKARYRQAFHQKLNINNPQTFSEKILWLKINRYWHDPLVIQCADKYRVREYVTNCGCGDILNQIYGVFDSVNDIVWENLPNQFVLKWNFGAGYNIICSDKSVLNKKNTIKKLRKWGKQKCWQSHSEMQYKYIPKKIVYEKFLNSDRKDTIEDYKVYCFHSEPKAILVMHDRRKTITAEFFDTDWRKLELKKYPSTHNLTPRPDCLEKMLKCASKLSSPFPFVRVDFYIVDNRLIFGEMTFTPAGGLYMATTEINGISMGELLKIE